MSEGRRLMSQLKKRENEFALPLPFVLFSSSRDWMTPTHSGEDRSLLSLLIQMLISFENTHTNTPINNGLVAIWASLSSGKLTHKINHKSTLSQRGTRGTRTHLPKAHLISR